MSKSYFRTPKHYDGTELTTRRIGQLLPIVLSKIGEVYHQRADLIIAMWPNIIGPELAKMAQAVSFSNGILVVKVKNSTLHSLLSQNEKPRLLHMLRKRFPQIEIKTIYFRIG